MAIYFKSLVAKSRLAYCDGEVGWKELPGGGGRLILPPATCRVSVPPGPRLDPPSGGTALVGQHGGGGHLGSSSFPTWGTEHAIAV